MNLLKFQNYFNEESKCLAYLEEIRWANGRTCPHCKTTKTYKFSNGLLFKCGGCRKQFSAKSGTIFSDSKIPLSKWLTVIYLATELEKGISSMQASRYVDTTQKTAWHMLHRIRSALDQSSLKNGYQFVLALAE